MTRRRRQQSFLTRWRQALGPFQREIAGVLLLALTLLTTLSLFGVTSGALSDRWSDLLLRLLGWGAYPLVAGLMLAGVWLVWEGMRTALPIKPAQVVGLELWLLGALVATQGLIAAEDPLAAVSADRLTGGYVGAVLLMLTSGLLGDLGAWLLVVAALALGTYLMLAPTWDTWAAQAVGLWDRVATAYRRWRVARQAVAVEPASESPRWLELPKKRAKTPKAKRTSGGQRRKPSPDRDDSLPPLELLNRASAQTYGDTDVLRKIDLIEETLSSFGVPAKVVEVNRGPAVTQFGIEPGYVERRASDGQVRRRKVRVSKITSLSNDLALALAAAPIRVEAPVPGRPVVGLEVPNDHTAVVSLRRVMESPVFLGIDSNLAIALGDDVSGRPLAVDLAAMPHLLIAGATGSGKSVCVNSIVCCLLFNNTPDMLQIVMVDPKMVELTGYNEIPHLVAPVITDPEQVVAALAWLMLQMDGRYKLFNRMKVRNLDGYNRKAARRRDLDTLPKLVLVIDELADLMMVAPDEVERGLCRLAQMGRATGIHLVVATQRPSVDVVTGLIKANFPARISFAVTSQIDSRVVLDQGGAESLLGKGDMLFQAPDQPAPVRLQGCFVSDAEIARLTEHWRKREGAWVEPAEEPAAPWEGVVLAREEDELLPKAIDLARGRERLSTSFLQRQLRVGYPRAARLMDALEEREIVGPDEGGGRSRRVLLGREDGIDFDEIEERLPGVEPS
jgi:S-DNA-T family DNA segregation ATPase FtsK/SpoIIIE